MLRASGLATDTDINLALIAEGGDSDRIVPSPDDSGGTALDDHHRAVPHADLLTRFVDAATTDRDQLEAVRSELVNATDEATMLDAAAVIGAFEMMTRIADGTGTTHPEARLESLEPVRTELGLDAFESARTATA